MTYHNGAITIKHPAASFNMAASDGDSSQYKRPPVKLGSYLISQVKPVSLEQLEHLIGDSAEVSLVNRAVDSPALL